jgi:hypothetical protein
MKHDETTKPETEADETETRVDAETIPFFAGEAIEKPIVKVRTGIRAGERKYKTD